MQDLGLHMIRYDDFHSDPNKKDLPFRVHIITNFTSMPIRDILGISIMHHHGTLGKEVIS